MESLTLTLLGITALFFVILWIKSVFNLKKLCVICISVTLAWIVLLILYFSGVFNDKILIALLMGHTSLGLFYLFYDKLGILRLPYLSTNIFIIYSVLNGLIFNGLYFILGLWLFFFLIYLSKKNKKISKLAKKIIECCRKW